MSSRSHSASTPQARALTAKKLSSMKGAGRMAPPSPTRVSASAADAGPNFVSSTQNNTPNTVTQWATETPDPALTALHHELGAAVAALRALWGTVSNALQAATGAVRAGQKLDLPSSVSTDVCAALNGVLFRIEGEALMRLCVAEEPSSESPLDQLLPILAAFSLAAIPSEEAQGLAARGLTTLVATMLSESAAEACKGRAVAIRPAVRCEKLFEHHHVLEGIVVALKGGPSHSVAVSLSEVLLVAVARSDEIRRSSLFSSTGAEIVELVGRSPMFVDTLLTTAEETLQLPTLAVFNLVAVVQSMSAVKPAEDSAMLLVGHSMHDVALRAIVRAAAKPASAAVGRRSGSSSPPRQFVEPSPPNPNSSVAASDATVGNGAANPEMHASVLGMTLQILASLVRYCGAAFDYGDPAFQATAAHAVSALLLSPWSDVVEGACRLLSALSVRYGGDAAATTDRAAIDADAKPALSSPTSADREADFGTDFFRFLTSRGDAHVALVAAVACKSSVRVAAAGAQALASLAMHAPRSLLLGGKLFTDVRVLHVLCSVVLDASVAASDEGANKDVIGNRVLQSHLAVAFGTLLAQSDATRQQLRRHAARALSESASNALQRALVTDGLQVLHQSVYRSFRVLDTTTGVDLVGHAMNVADGQRASRTSAAPTRESDKSWLMQVLGDQAQWELSKSTRLSAEELRSSRMRRAGAGSAASGNTHSSRVAAMQQSLLEAAIEVALRPLGSGRRTGNDEGERSGVAPTPAPSLPAAAVRRQAEAGAKFDQALGLLMQLCHHGPLMVQADKQQRTSAANAALEERIRPVRAEKNPYATSARQAGGVATSGRSASVSSAASTASTARSASTASSVANNRRWSVKNVERKDLFLLEVAVPGVASGLPAAPAGSSSAQEDASAVAASNRKALSLALSRAIRQLERHCESINTNLQLCPMAKHQRRAVLLDLWTNVLPVLHDILSRLLSMLDVGKGQRAEDAERMLVQLLRDRGDVAITCGNVLAIHAAMDPIFGDA